MIKSVKVTNYLGESQVMELRNPEKSGFLISSIEGVSSGKANINTTNIATKDGAYFNSAHIEPRNIILGLKLLAKPTIEEARHKLYRLFQPKRLVRLDFVLDTRECYIEGYVEENPVEIFSSSESTRISIICPDPFFKAMNEVTEVFSGVVGQFEFPFENVSISEKLLEFGSVSFYTEKNIIYEGEDEIGLEFQIHASGSVGDITIYNTVSHESMVFSSEKLSEYLGEGIKDGDDLIITTMAGNKGITLLREGLYYNVLNCLGRYSDWFQLSNGENIFTYSATYGVLNLEFTAKYRPVYGGI